MPRAARKATASNCRGCSSTVPARRGTIALERCSRAHAWLNGKGFVSPDDVAAVIHDCLRHRLILSFEAEADGVTRDQAIDQLLKTVPIA